MQSIKRYPLCCLLIFLVAACSTSQPASSSSSPSTKRLTQTTTSAPTETAKLGGPNCHPPSSINATGEIQGTAQGVELWALLAGRLQAKEQIKIVWRITGNGTDFHVVALGPQGIRAPLIFGPEQHRGSNWNRPGAEWGTGFSLPVAGCYDFHVTSGTASGDVWLIVT